MSTLRQRVHNSMCTLKFEFHLNHSYVPTEEETLTMLGASEVFGIIKVDSEINKVVVPIVSASQAYEAIATLSIFLEQQHNNVNELKTKLLPSE